MPKVSEFVTGVYCLRNEVSGKVYVGSSATSVKRRLRSYLPSLRGGKCHNRHLQFAFDKYGEDAFTFKVLEYCSPEECVVREDYWIAKLKATDPRHGYNVCLKAGSRLGVGHREESRSKMSATKKAVYATKEGPRTGAVLSEETKERIRLAHLGKRMSEESRRKMSEARKGLAKSAETCAKLKANHWSKGPRAEEIAARIRAANLGKTISAKTRAKISATKLGAKKRKIVLPAVPLAVVSLFDQVEGF